MSGQFTGMDILAVRELATLMSLKATEIETLTTAVGSKLSTVQWVGADREAFENEWANTAVINLKNVAALLNDYATKANNNAAEQESASSK